MGIDTGGGPHLVVLTPGADRGRCIPIDRDYLVVGREASCDVRFDDPCVSRSHAALQRHGDSVRVQDLGSSGGTAVNGSPVTTAHELRPGDIVAFATVTARLESTAGRSEETRSMPVPARPAAQEANYRIGGQSGQNISNVGRDQHNAYVQQIVQQRENFLREIAATKTRARWLIWLGFAAFLLGFGLFAAADLSFLKNLSDSFGSDSPPSVSSPFGRDIAGIPSGLIGWALGMIGSIMILVGIVLHIIATARRRRINREFPVTPPWPGAGPSGG